MSILNKESYTFVEVEGAIVVHEWLRDTTHDPSAIHCGLISGLFSAYGSSAMRSISAHAGVIVEKCWLTLTDDDRAGTVWDWEFVPMICQHIDWDTLAQNNQYGVGDYEPDYDRFMATVWAARALRVA